MQTRVLWLMWGILAALVAGGWLLDAATKVPGTYGTFKAVLPAARWRARQWAPQARLVGFWGQDLVDGRSGDGGLWRFDFEDPTTGDACEVTAGDHLLALASIPLPTATDEIDPGQLEDTDTAIRQAVGYGMGVQDPATISYATGQFAQPAASGPIYVISTAGGSAGTWILDARTGALLKYRLGPGINEIR